MASWPSLRPPLGWDVAVFTCCCSPPAGGQPDERPCQHGDEEEPVPLDTFQSGLWHQRLKVRRGVNPHTRHTRP